MERIDDDFEDYCKEVEEQDKNKDGKKQGKQVGN
jgi:hypothetical protein